jgi:hypothetical protein
MKTCDLTQITDKLNIVFSTLHHEWDSNSHHNLNSNPLYSLISSESDGKTGYYMDSYGPSDNCNMVNHTSGNNVSMATTASTATAS